MFFEMSNPLLTSNYRNHLKQLIFRSPTHQIQIYNQYGQFVRKFGANILQHPRGVTVDNKGRIIVVECKVRKLLFVV